MMRTPLILMAIAFWSVGLEGVLTPLEPSEQVDSLTSCVSQAISQHIPKSETINVLLPRTASGTTNRDTLPFWYRYLLTNLTRDAHWSLVTARPGERYHRRPPGRDNFLIFLERPGELSLDGFSWNHRSAFVVVSLARIPDATLLADVAGYLWGRQIVNGIVLAAERDGGGTFGVHAWFPFARRSCGEGFGEVRRIDGCEAGVFESGTAEVLVRRDPRRFEGCAIDVGYAVNPPFVVEGGGGGIDVKLLEVVTWKLGLEATFRYSETMGEVFENGSGKGNLRLLAEGEIDLVLGGYTSTRLRYLHFDSSRPYFYDKLVWCVPYVRLYRSPWTNLRSDRWFASLSVAFCAASIWLIVSAGDRRLRHAGDVVLFVLASTVGKATPCRPTSPTVRLLVANVLLFGFYATVAFETALFGVFATRAAYREKYPSVAHALRDNLTVYLGPNAARYFEDGDRSGLGEYVECENYATCVAMVASQRRGVCFGSESVIGYLHREMMMRDNVNVPLIKCFKEQFSVSCGILMRKRFPLYSIVDNVVGNLLDHGFLSKWTRDSRSGTKTRRVKMKRHKIVFGQLRPVFDLMLVLYSIASAVFVLELIVHRYKRLSGKSK